MPPYGRDAGMTQRDADSLAGAVREAGVAVVSVEREDRYFVVVTETATGRYTLRDQADWAWLRRHIAAT